MESFKINKNSIGFKIFAIMIPIMIVSSVILTSFSYVKTNKEMRELSENFLMQISKDTATIVQKEIRGNAQLSEEVANYISLKGLIEPNEIIEELKTKLESTSYKALGFADKDGNYIDTNGKTTNIGDTSHFEMAIGGTRAASELYTSKIDGSLEVAYCAPLKYGEEIIGVIVGTKDGLEYSKIANSIDIGHDGFAVIIDREAGQILAYPDDEVVKSLTTIDEFVNTNKKYEGFAKAANEMKENIQGITRYEIDGENKLVAHTGILSDYWVIGIILDEDSILKGSKEIRTFLIILTVVLVIVATGLIIYISRNISNGVRQLKVSINEIADGNFTNEVDLELKNRKDEIGEIAQDIEKINVNISKMVSNIKYISEDVDLSSKELNRVYETLNMNNENISHSINDVAQGNSVQTNNLSDITVKLGAFNTLLSDMNECINSISNVANEIDVNAKESNNDMRVVTNAIKELTSKFDMFINMINSMGVKFEGITNITALIQQISEKTNLLSLNAAIESARAGEAGKGFSVVAEEIRKLAMESGNSTKEINNAITEILGEIKVLVNESELMSNYINSQVESINKAISSFENISSSIDKIQPMINEVSEKSVEVEEEKKGILTGIDELLAISEEVTASSEEIASSSEKVSELSNNVTESSSTLVELTDKMREELENFRINE